MTRWMIAACSLGFLSLLGCGGEVTVYDGGGPHAVEHPERPAYGSESPWTLCPDAWFPTKPSEAGRCPGVVPAGELQAEEAEQIFGRMIDEVGHVAARLGLDAGDTGGLFELDGDRLVGVHGAGWVDGLVARDGKGERSCASLTMVCWTGGHGGFGPSALEGDLEVLLEGDVVQARGKLGLVEGGALSGAPAVAVEARIEHDAASGTVGSFEL